MGYIEDQMQILTMVKASGPEIVHDPSSTFARKPTSGASAREWRNFMSSSIKDMYNEPMHTDPVDKMDSNEELDIGKMLKEIESFGASHRSWKEQKEFENHRIVDLGGKAPKKQRLPLSVAKPMMKKRKEREQKALQQVIAFANADKNPSNFQGMMLGWLEKHGNKNDKVEKRKAEDRVLKGSEGHFKKGVLNVGHLLRAPSSSSNDADNMHKVSRKKKKKGKGKKGKKNKKGKRH
ncbi:hypothetical protein ACLOJK_005955 [Asimina triloba]